MQNRTTLSLSIFMGFALQAQLTLAEPSRNQSMAPQQPRMQVLVYDSQMFCQRVNTAFKSYGASRGLDLKHSSAMAAGTVNLMIADFRAGRASDFIDASVLDRQAGLTSEATPVNTKFVSLSEVVASSLGLSSSKTLMALSVGELRFLPHAPADRDLVVIASNAAALTPERARNVVQMAQKMKIKIHVIWVGKNNGPESAKDAQSLAFLASVTGGGLLDLGGDKSPCGSET